MYSKEETQRIKKEFWIAFAQKHPRKWVLYDTKIKDFSFKFYIDNKKAEVLIAIEHKSEEKRLQYFEKVASLKNILENEFIKGLFFEKNYILENEKTISKIAAELRNVNINNKQDWNIIFSFFNEKMSAFEAFYFEYQAFISD